MARALFLQISGALVATLCQDQALKLVRVHNKVLHLLWLCVSLEALRNKLLNLLQLAQLIPLGLLKSDINSGVICK